FPPARSGRARRPTGPTRAAPPPRTATRPPPAGARWRPQAPRSRRSGRARRTSLAWEKLPGPGSARRRGGCGAPPPPSPPPLAPPQNLRAPAPQAPPHQRGKERRRGRPRPAELERHADPVAQETPHAIARAPPEERQHHRVESHGPLDVVPASLGSPRAVGE